MRLNASPPALFALLSFFCFGSSLPFFRRGSPWMEPLARRETYSVVNVDAGSAETTVIETITATPAAETKTITETDRITLESVTTDYLISTQTISGPETTQSLLITITPSPSPITVTATAYSIVNVGPASASTASSEIPVPPSTSITSSASSTSAAASTSAEKSSTSLSITPATISTLTVILSGGSLGSATPSQDTSTHSSSASATTLASALSEPATYISSLTSFLEISTVTSISTMTSPVPLSTSTKTYNNGQWHTSYPPWSNGTATPALPVSPTQTPSTIAPDAARNLDAAASTIYGRMAEIGVKMFKKMSF